MVLISVASTFPILWIELEGLHWPHPTFQLIALIDLGFVGILGGDFLWRLWQAGSRVRFVREHWIEAISLIPLYAESLSWFRVARLMRLGRVLRLLRVVTAMQRTNRMFRFLDVLINRSKIGHVFVLASAVVIFMAVVVWILERDTNPQLATFSESLWWAIVTATTVGYGDITPHTGLARAFAAGLMLLGIGLIGVVASSMSAALLTVDSEKGKAAQNAPPSLAEELERLARLHCEHALTDAEFAEAKRHTIASRTSP